MGWRPEAAAHALDQESVDMCVLPGSCLPPGAVLPPAFPHLVQGPRSADWDSVAVFFRPELELALRPL
eukprot:4691145-Pyramimonas_sp.AAC.1